MTLLNYLSIVLALSLSTSLPLLAADVMPDKEKIATHRKNIIQRIGQIDYSPCAGHGANDNSGTRLHLADLRYPVAALATRRSSNG